MADRRLSEAKKEVQELKAKIADAATGVPPRKLNPHRPLVGHGQKVVAVDWSEGNNAASAAQDGNIIVWNGLTTNKLSVIPCSSTWLMACAISHDAKFVATGGLDNTCSVHSSAPNQGLPQPVAKLKHDGYISSSKFMQPGKIVTGSGDKTCVLWDYQTSNKLTAFEGHTSDVSCIDRLDANVFLSGACGGEALLWDLRQEGMPPLSLTPGTNDEPVDLEALTVGPGPYTFVGGYSDGVCRVIDIRARKTIQECALAGHSGLGAVKAVGVSRSGRFIFTSYANGAHPEQGGHMVWVWDTLTGKPCRNANLVYHNKTVSCLGVRKDGMAVCTGSWDNNLVVWG